MKSPWLQSVRRVPFQRVASAPPVWKEIVGTVRAAGLPVGGQLLAASGHNSCLMNVVGLTTAEASARPFVAEGDDEAERALIEVPP